MCRKLTNLILVVLVLGVAARPAVGGVSYADPFGGWRYIYPGVGDAGPDAAALDGKWDHNNGSDAWDASLIGAGQAGGIIALSDGGVSFLRIQDALTSGSGTDSRKIYFGHQLTTDGVAQATADQILSVEGITLSFRARLATTPPLDGTWPPTGDGYVIHDGGKGPFGVHQETGGDQTISFGLVLAGDTNGEPKIAGRSGLCMNNLNGTAPSGTVDIQGNEAGTLNMLDIANLTIWHEFWITIQPDTSGGGTHLVKIWMDGSMAPSQFHVTAGTGGDYTYSYVALGAGATPQSGATDIDFFAYKEGVHLPPGAQKKASQPIPADKARTPPSGISGTGYFMLLQFRPGDTATSHTAYFSSKFDDVNDRNPAFRLGSPPYPEMYPTGYYVGLDVPELPAFARVPLQRGTIYYWAVDESNGVGTYPGDVWSFTIAAQQAWDPTPPSGDLTVNADPDVALSWKLGDVDTTGKTVSYDVYYGTVFADVNTSTTPTVHVTTTSAVTGSLPANTVYYWRVDTVLTQQAPPFASTKVKGDVWNFKTLPVVAITDPDLVGWWKLDGDIVPAVAFDSSGYANHGTLRGNPKYVAGQVDNAMDFGGSGDYVYTGKTASQLGIAGNAPRTVSVWVYTRAFNNGGIWDVGARTDGQDFCLRTLTTANAWRVQYWGASDIDFTYPSLNEWVHFGHVHDGASTRIYANGQLTADQPRTLSTADTNPFQLAQYGWPGNYFNGIIDDLRLYTKVLSAKELKVLAGLVKASRPNPANIATGVARTPTLSWEPGAYAASVSGHKVYFSADRDAVMNRAVAGITRTDPCYPVATTLDLGKTYYWAVDEVNNLHLDKMWPGDLWSFTTVNYLVVDDMEKYVPNVANPTVYQVWVDGAGDCASIPGNNSGALVDISTLAALNPVHGDQQAMKLVYDNDGTVNNPCPPGGPTARLTYSKAEALVAKLPSGIGSDWTAGGVTKALSLWFYGDPLNSIEPMWVQLTDASNNKAKVLYGKYADEDVKDVNEASWHEWLIDLADFTGVGLTNVKSIAIGIGNEAGPAGSSGTLYFDDIRLYTPRCVLTRRSADFAKLDYAPEADGGDCVINGRELEVMTRDWLLTDSIIPAEAIPPAAHLLVNYRFELNTLDSSTNALHGTPGGAPTYELRAAGDNAIVLAGSDYVNCGNPPQLDFGTGDWSVCAWIKTTETADAHTVFAKGGDQAGGIRYTVAIGENGPAGCATLTTDDDTTKLQAISTRLVNDNEWHHVVGQRAGTTLRVYVDAIPDGTNTCSPAYNLAGTSQHNAYVGAITDHTDLSGATLQKFFVGSVADLRIYDYALTQGQIITAAGLARWHIPVPSAAELYEGEAEGSRVINFRDYAVLTDRWLEEDMYP